MKSIETAAEILKAIGLSLLIFFTFIGNSFVLVVILIKERRLLHKPLYIFICNICISDVLASIFTMTFEVSEEITHRWLYGEAVCKMVAFLEMSLFGVNIFTHLSIAIDRYVNVVHPLKPPIKIRTAKKLIVVAWCFPTIMALPYVYTYRLRRPEENGYTVCMATSIPVVWLEKAYGSFELLVVFLIPLLGLFFMYIVIIHKLFQRKLQINDIGSSSRTTIRAANYGSRISIAVVCVFIGCWVPFIVMYIIRLFTTAENVARTDGLFVTALYFSFVSELVSPILYCAFDRNIRPALSRILVRIHSRRSRRNGGLHGETNRNETTENRTENPLNDAMPSRSNMDNT